MTAHSRIGAFGRSGTEPFDRRTGNRHLAVFKIARLIIGKHDQLCIIRNMSDRGMMLQTHRSLRTDQQIEIEVRSDQRFCGIVRWARVGSAGVELDEPIDVAALLRTAPPIRRGAKPRAPRFRRQGTAIIRTGDRRIEAEIFDISVSGACVLALRGLHVRQIVTIAISGLEDRKGEIRWLDNETTGIQFLQPLPIRELDSWLEQAAAARAG